jgi:hypothetical protein
MDLGGDRGWRSLPFNISGEGSTADPQVVITLTTSKESSPLGRLDGRQTPNALTLIRTQPGLHTGTGS